ncbi:MAG: hypothetical protein J7M39_09135 [Anaerolineae bacterium]|nr:hypothetical protein [Anaerolineae bacterium]
MTERYVKLKRILFMAGFIAALGLPLMFLMENFIRDAIITPVAYLAWVAGVVLDALPQSYLLATVIAVAIYAAARSLSREPPPPRRHKLTSAPPEGMATSWHRRLQLTSKGAYSQQRIQQQIGQLILQVIAHEQRLTTREVARRIEAGEIETPADVDVYIKAATYRGLPRTPSLLGRLKSFVVGISSPKNASHTVALDLDPALRYVEAQLRMKQSGGSR